MSTFPTLESIARSLLLPTIIPKAAEQPAEQYRRYWHDTPEAIFA